MYYKSCRQSVVGILESVDVCYRATDDKKLYLEIAIEQHKAIKRLCRSLSCCRRARH